MIRAQMTVTPSEAKRLIAKGVAQMPEVRAALEHGMILLKGGTTVSAVAEELAGVSLNIAGRITPHGAKTVYDAIGNHRLLIEKGRVRSLDAEADFDEAGAQAGKNDVAIIGANALDVNRQAALMAAGPLGGSVARVYTGLMSQGVTTIITVGWEKLIPCPLGEALTAAGRERIDLAMGAAVGLVPLTGIVITETDAVSILSGVKATVIGAGGVTGAEGSTTFVVEGEPAHVKAAWEIVYSIKGAKVSGRPDSLVECTEKSPRCAAYVTYGSTRFPVHRACAYRDPNLLAKVFSSGAEKH